MEIRFVQNIFLNTKLLGRSLPRKDPGFEDVIDLAEHMVRSI